MLQVWLDAKKSVSSQLRGQLLMSFFSTCFKWLQSISLLH